MSILERFNFFPYSWTFEDEETNQGWQCIIRTYGWNDKNESVYCRIEDMQIPIYVELPTHIDWSEDSIKLVCNTLQRLNYNKKFQPVYIGCEYRERSYYAHVEKIKNPKNGIKYKHKTFPFLCVLFSSIRAQESFSMNLRKEIMIPGMGKLRFRVHCDSKKLTPVLKLIGIKQLPSAGWIKCKGIKIPTKQKESTRKHEYAMSYHDLIPMTDEESAKMPIVKPKVLAFDNEANSTIMSSMPKTTRPGDVTFQIGCSILDNKPSKSNDKKYRKFLLTLGDPDPIDGIEIIKCPTEADLYVAFTELVRKEDPEIIIGYNIMKFDIPYMIQRCEKICRCMGEFDLMGCIEGKHGKKENISWSSSAYGKQEFEFLNCEGRLIIDLLPCVQRGFKLPNYRLETVCDEFLKTNKDPLKPKDIFRCYRQFTPESLALVGKYCYKDAEVCLMLWEQLLIWEDMSESASVNSVPIFDMFTSGQQIKLYSQLFRYCFHNNKVMESNAYVVKDNERYTGAYVSEPIKGLYHRIIPFDFCLTGNTLVSLSSGISKRLDNLKDETVLGYNENGFNNYDIVHGLQNKGLKDTIKIWLHDGTTICCTPDHKFMTDKGEWIRADELKNKKVMCGLEYPEDIKYIDEQDWKLKLGNISLSLNTNRDEILAFVRMLGYILSDGSIYITKKHNQKCVEACFGTMIDALNFAKDINRFTNKKINIRKKKPKPGNKREIKGTTYAITLPLDVADLFHSIEDIIVGKRSTQEMKLPKFILQENCPLSVIKEFLGGLYGGDGRAPHINKTKNTFCHISFKWTTIEKYRSNMITVFQQLMYLHNKLGIFPTLLNPILVKYGPNSIKPKDLDINPRWDIQLSLKLDDTLIFAKTIGFKYCVNKSCRLTVAYSYQKMQSKTREQHKQILDRTNKLIDETITNVFSHKQGQPTFASCLEIARNELLQQEPAINEYSLSSVKDINYQRGEAKRHADKPRKLSLQMKKFPKALSYIEQLGVTNWFTIDTKQKQYAVKTDDINIPSFHKSVIDIRNNGVQKVYDIEINTSHNFLANGVVTHNCSLYPNTMRAYNIDYSKLVTDPNIPDEDCHVFEWSEHTNCKCPKDPDPTKKPKKGKDGKPIRVCAEYKYKWLKHQVSGNGILPDLLNNVLDARKRTRKQIAINTRDIKILTKILNREEFIKDSQNDDEKDFQEMLKAHEKLQDDIYHIIKFRKTGEIMKLIDQDIKFIKEKIASLKAINIVLEKRQLAFKVNANSMYGATGVKKGYAPFLPAAMCVTYMGRTNILKVNEFIQKECNGIVIYNDTDSSYCYFPDFKDKSVQELWGYVLEIVQKVKKLFPPELSLEFEEKIYEQFLILTKKRYAARYVNSEGKYEGKLMKRGIVLQRRDNPAVLRDIYEKLLFKIFEHHNKLVKLDIKDKKEVLNSPYVKEILDLISSSIDSIFRWKYNYKQFVITKQMTKIAKEYKNPDKLPSHVLLGLKMQARGVPVGAGSRIEYLILNTKKYKKTDTQKDKIEDVNYFAEFREVLRVCFLSYLKQFINPLDEICTVVLGIEDFVKNQLDYRINYSKVVDRIKHLGRPKIEYIENDN